MIRQFLREHLIWYILYIMMFVLFFISFYLYHLPMPYLFNSLGLNVIVLLGISIWQYSRYRKKMLHLKYFNSSQGPLSNFNRVITLILILLHN